MSKKRNIVTIVVLLFAGVGAFVTFSDDSQTPTSVAPNNSNNEKSEDIDVPGEDVVLNETVKKFTSIQYKELYDSLSLPNIKPIIEAPPITENLDADRRIRELAEARGYRLRDVTSGLLNELEGRPVQELLIADWNALALQAKADGISIEFISGYRSIEEQATLFNERLETVGARVDEIAGGEADTKVDSILAYTAPPGYSRHHSGYTIDVADPGFSVFADSDAYVWMSNDNYANAKAFGFIPSYPPDITNQGPEPEPWEFVWVGKEITYGVKQ